ncbi:MAG: hypothetical protein HUU57_05770 [Bdellovibrio sp.]|nr:hypothetical protein [Bdellovibrio sp.]
MQVSNSLILRALTSAFVTLTMAACNLPSPKDKNTSEPGDTAATFSVQGAAEKSKALESSVQGAFALPASKVFNFQACLKDVAYDKAIPGHDFYIAEAKTKVTSDRASCVTWSEDVAFNFLGESQYIRVTRTIQGMGLHKGVRKVSFAINPWSHGENLTPVLNPEDGNNVPRLVQDAEAGQLALKGFSLDSKKLVTRPLWVEDGRLFVTEQKLHKDGIDLLVEIRPNLSIQMTKMNGEVFLRPLTAGHFKAQLKLIHIYQQDNKEIRRLLAESPSQEVKMDNGTLAIKSALTLPVIPTRGQMMVGIELIPVNGPQGLLKFDGLYLIGEYDQIKGSSFLKLNTMVAQKKGFKLNEFVNSSLTQISHKGKDGAVDEQVYQKPKIESQRLEIRYLRVGKETTTTREIHYNITACVRHGLDSKSNRSHEFKVTRFRQSDSEPAQVTKITTDHNSCISWDESITFNYFECQHYIKGHVQIASEQLGMDEKLEIILNPWEAQGVIGRDMRYIDRKESLALSCKDDKRPQSSMVIEGYSFSTQAIDYEVDANLSLTLKKTVAMKMDPRILVYSNLSNGRSEYERIRDGIYLVKLAVVQNTLHDPSNTYVAHTERFVNVLGGQINTLFTFSTADFKALGNRNTLLVEIYPALEDKLMTSGKQITLKDPSQPLDSAIDLNSGLITSTFAGAITLDAAESNRPLSLVEPAEMSQYFISGVESKQPEQKFLINQIVKKGLQINAEIAKRLKAQTAKSVAAQNLNMDLISLDAIADKDKDKALISKLGLSSELRKELQISKADLADFANRGTLTPTLAAKLCAFWGNDYMPTVGNKKGVFEKTQGLKFGLDCFQEARANPASFFITEKHALVKSVKDTGKFLGAAPWGLTVGTNFSANSAHSKAKTYSASLAAKGGLSKKVFDLVSFAVDGAVQVSWSRSDSKTTSNAVSVNENTNLRVEKIPMSLVVDRYEQCAIVKLNPRLFFKDTRSILFKRRDYIGHINQKMTDEEKAEVVTRGLMICEGTDRTNPVKMQENYYRIYQDLGDGRGQDTQHALNRTFFTALRSDNDYKRFIIAIKEKSTVPESDDTSLDTKGESLSAMEQVFMMPGPSQPSMHLIRAGEGN